MPFLAAIPAWLGTLATVASAGTSIGLGINGAVNAGKAGAPNPTAATPAPAIPTGPSEGSLQATIGQTANDLVSNTSGLANPDYYGTLAPIFSGEAGQTNTNSALSAVMKSLFGGPNSTNNQSFTPAGTSGSSSISGPINLSDFVYQLGGAGA